MDETLENRDSSGDAVNPRAPDQNELRWIAGIWFVAVMLRFANLLEIRDNDPFFRQPSVDPLFYHRWAVEISQGDWLGEGVFLQGPLFPYLLSLLYGLIGPNFFASRFINCIIGSLVCVLVWLVARRLFDRRVALLAAAMAGLYSMFIFYEGSLLIANILLPLNLLVLLLGIRAAERPSRGAWLSFGAIIGLASLARPNMILCIPLGVLWLFWLLWARADLRRSSALAGFFLLGCAISLGPSSVRNRVVTGEWILVSASGGMNFFNGNNPDANGTHNVPRIFDRSQADHPAEQNRVYRAYAEAQLGRELSPSGVSDYWYGRGFEYVREHPAEWLRLLGKKFSLFFNAHERWNNRSYEVTSQFSWVLRMPLLGFGVVGPLALLGLVVSAPRWRHLLPLYGLIAVYLATTVIFFALSRYRIPAVPVLIIFAATALIWLFDSMKSRRYAAAASALAGLLVAGWALDVEILRDDLSMAYYNLGNKYQKLDRHAEAIEQYRHSLEINDSYISAHNNLAGSLEASAGLREEAVEAWRRVRELGQRRGIPRYVERADRHLLNLQQDPRS
jgi:4-amino-4-deoxy-L-arabinose transferase-like glycosyltransferase